jgi:hypothetical protein
MKNLENSEETEESDQSGESDESEMSLLDVSLSQNQILRRLIKVQVDKNTLLEARITTLQAQLDQLRKASSPSNPGTPAGLPQVG